MILDAPSITNQTVLDYLMRKNNERTLEGLAKEKIQVLSMESSSQEESLTTDDRNILEDMIKWIKEDGSSVNSKEPYDKIYLYGTRGYYIYVTNNDHFKSYLKDQTVE